MDEYAKLTHSLNKQEIDFLITNGAKREFYKAISLIKRSYSLPKS